MPTASLDNAPMQLHLDKFALVAMDFQPSILATLANPAAVLANAAEAVAATRATLSCVATVRVAFTPAELARFPSHSAMGSRMRANESKVLLDAPTTQIAPELGSRRQDIAVRKTRVSPFWMTNFHARLQSRGIDTLVLAGIHTSGCVLSAVRDAHDLDYRLIILSDACDDPDPATHAFLMDTIFPKQASVTTVTEFQATLACAQRRFGRGPTA